MALDVLRVVAAIAVRRVLELTEDRRAGLDGPRAVGVASST
jgi:hypothetical protein